MADYADFLELKVGDVVRRVEGYHNGMEPDDTDKVAPASFYCQTSINLEKFGEGHAHYNLELVKDDLSVMSPIRTVTKRELVPGLFGKVRVNETGFACDWMTDAADLRASAKTLIEIADYLESAN